MIRYQRFLKDRRKSEEEEEKKKQEQLEPRVSTKTYSTESTISAGFQRACSGLTAVTPRGKKKMRRLRLLCAMLATLAQPGSVDLRHIGDPATALATDAQQFKRVPHNVRAEIGESREWKPNLYVRRGPRQGVLFMPKPSTTPFTSYFTTKIAIGKRCADDFDCMRVLGQVCRRSKRGNSGHCQCPESTPVHLADETQPRCVAARHVFEDCADTVECSFLNPHVECINQVCTCQPPNILKHKEICVPAGITPRASKAISWTAGVIIFIGVTGVIIVVVRKLSNRNGSQSPVGPTYHSQYWREDRPNVWDSTKAIVSEIQDKVRALAQRRRMNGAAAAPAMRVAAYVPGSSKPNARHVRITTVKADVHRSLSPDEDAGDLPEGLLPTQDEVEDQNDRVDLSPTSRDLMLLKEEPSDRRETSLSVSRHTGHVVDSKSASRSEAEQRLRKAGLAGKDESPENLSGGQASAGHVFDPESDAERIMKMVLHQLALERRSVGLVHGSAKEAVTDVSSKKAGSEGKPTIEFSSDRIKRCQENFPVDMLPVSNAARSIYSHTLVTLRNKILSNNRRDAGSVDDVSYGDSCKPCDEKDCIENNGEVCRAGGMQRMDKGAGEDKTKLQADIPTWSRPFSGVKGSASSKEGVCSDIPLKAPQKPKAIRSETMSEQKLLPQLMEASLLGSRPDPALESYRSYTCPVDAYPVIQNWTMPKRTYLIKDSNQCRASHSYHSFSDTSRSRFWKGSRKSPVAPSVFSQSTGRCGAERQMSALRAHERSGKTGDTFKSFMSSILYPNSTAVTSTRSAGCFQTTYSDVPQKRTFTKECKDGASDRSALRKAPRVHYYDTDLEHGKIQEPNQSSNLAGPLGRGVQPMTNVGQAQPGGTVVKKRSILKNASSSFDKKNAKIVQCREEERPLLLSAQEPRSRGECSRTQSPCGTSTAESHGESVQTAIISGQAIPTNDSDALLNRNEVPRKEFPSLLAELKSKVPTKKTMSGTPSRTSSSTRRSSKHSKTKTESYPDSISSMKKGTNPASTVTSKRSSDGETEVKSCQEPKAMNEVNTAESAQEHQPSLTLSDELTFSGKSARLATHFNKLKLPFGVKLGGERQQWSKALDRQMSRVNQTTSQTPSPNAIVNAPTESFADRCEANFTPEDAAKKGYARQQQPTPDDVINLNITEDELIRCINRLVAINSDQDQNIERKFPEAFAEQTPVSGCQLMRDTLLHSEAVSSEASERRVVRRDTDRCSSSQSDALNRPLYSLRRGDLKNILKEILEEEYSHLLHMSAQVAPEGTTDTKVSDPIPRGTDHGTNATSETSKLTSLNMPSVQGCARSEITSTAAGDACRANHSQSDAVLYPTTAAPKKGTSTESSQAEGDTTCSSSSNTKSSSTSTALTSQEDTRSSTRRLTSESSRARSFKYTAGTNRRARLAEQHLEAVSEDTLIDGDRLDVKNLSRSDVNSKTTSCRTRNTSISTDVFSSSVEQGDAHGTGSTDPQGERLLSDISVESTSTSKPPVPCLSFPAIADFPLAQPHEPIKIFTDEEWQQEEAFETIKRSQVSWNPPAYMTLPDVDATVFSYTEVMSPPDVKPTADIALSASHASLTNSQRDLKPFPHTGLLNRSESYIPFGNWSCHPPLADADCMEGQQRFNGRSPSNSASQAIAKTAPGAQEKDTALQTIPNFSQRPKSASFHGFSRKHGGSEGLAVAENQRTKSHTEYWLKTVSLYQELTTDQMSSSGETCTDASGTNTIFEPEQIEALEQAKLRDDARLKAMLQNQEVSPLLERFLMLQDMSLTSESIAAAEQTPRAINDECVGSGVQFDTSLPEYSLLNRFLETCSLAVDGVPNEQHSVATTDDHIQQGCLTVTDESARRGVISPTQEHNAVLSLSPETRSPNVDTVGNQASCEGSSSTSFFEENRVKTMRKKAPYRTPFPLCSSSRSTAGFRYNMRATKKNWKHRMAAVSTPAEQPTDGSLMQYFGAGQEHVTRLARSEALVPPRQDEDDVQRMSMSALPNPEAGTFWSSRSFHVQQWLNQAAQFFMNHEEGMRTAQDPQSVVSERLESSTPSEYYEAQPTTDTFAQSSEQAFTDDSDRFA